MVRIIIIIDLDRNSIRIFFILWFWYQMSCYYFMFFIDFDIGFEKMCLILIIVGNFYNFEWQSEMNNVNVIVISFIVIDIIF